MLKTSARDEILACLLPGKVRRTMPRASLTLPMRQNLRPHFWRPLSPSIHAPISAWACSSRKPILEISHPYCSPGFSRFWEGCVFTARPEPPKGGTTLPQQLPCHRNVSAKSVHPYCSPGLSRFSEACAFTLARSRLKAGLHYPISFRASARAASTLLTSLPPPRAKSGFPPPLPPTMGAMVWMILPAWSCLLNSIGTDADNDTEPE